VDPLEWKVEQLRRRRAVLEATGGAAWTRAQRRRAAERMERGRAAAGTAQGRNTGLQADLERAREEFRAARHALKYSREAAQWHVAREQFVQAGKDLYPQWRKAVNTFTHSRSEEVDRALVEWERRHEANVKTAGREQELREKMAQLWHAVGPPNLGESPQMHPTGGEDNQRGGEVASANGSQATLPVEGDGYRSDEVLRGSTSTSVEPSPRVHVPDGLGDTRDSMTSVKEAFAALSDSKLHLPLRETGLSGRPPLPRAGGAGSVGASPREWAQDTPRSQVSEGGNSSNLSTPRLENALNAAVERVLDGGDDPGGEAAGGGQSSRLSTPRLEDALATAVDRVLLPSAEQELPVQPSTDFEAGGPQGRAEAAPHPDSCDKEGAVAGGPGLTVPPELEGESSLSIPLDVSTALNETGRLLYRSDDEDFDFGIDKPPRAPLHNPSTASLDQGNESVEEGTQGTAEARQGMGASISEQSSGYVSPPSEEVEAERRAWQEEMQRRDRELAEERELERRAALEREAQVRAQIQVAPQVTPGQKAVVSHKEAGSRLEAAAPQSSPPPSRKSKLTSLSLPGVLGGDPFSSLGAERDEPELAALVPQNIPAQAPPGSLKQDGGGGPAPVGIIGRDEPHLSEPEPDVSPRVMGTSLRAERKKNISSIVTSALHEDDDDLGSGDDGLSFGETVTSSSAVSAASPIRTSADFDDEFDVF